MIATGAYTTQARREAVVIHTSRAEAIQHDIGATVATFRHPRYEVPALAVTADGTDAVISLIGGLLSAFPDFYLPKKALYQAENAVIVEAVFGGTQHGVWTGIPPAGKPMEVQGVLIFVFDDDDLVCEKVYFDHATILRQLGVA